MGDTWRELNAPDLVGWFARITDGNVMLGRDAKMLRTLMDERGITPTQMLCGMYLFSKMTPVKTIPAFVRTYQDWLIEDVLEAETELIAFMKGMVGALDPLPMCYWIYRDFRDGGLPSAAEEQAFRESKEELKEYLDGILDQPATARRHRKRPAGSNRG